MPPHVFDPNAYGKPSTYAFRKTNGAQGTLLANSTYKNIHFPPTAAQSAVSLQDFDLSLENLTNVRLTQSTTQTNKTDVYEQEEHHIKVQDQNDTVRLDLTPTLHETEGVLPAAPLVPSPAEICLDSRENDNHLSGEPALCSIYLGPNKLSRKGPDPRSGSPAQSSRVDYQSQHTVLSHVHSVSENMSPIHVDRNDRLKQLQDASLRQITRKTEARRVNDKNSSVSMRDLDLARSPVDPNNPAASTRPWAGDSLLRNNFDENEMVVQLQLKELSMVPQSSGTNATPAIPTEVPPSSSFTARRARWAVKDEMKAEKVEPGSNDWGSAVPSDGTTSTNSSDRSFGKLLKHKDVAAREELLADWEGKMLPPPEDWAERQRYNNNNIYFKNRFRHYIRDLEERFSNGVLIRSLPAKTVVKYDMHPDGIGMRSRTETISYSNAAYYGYTQDTEDAIKYAKTIDEYDYKIESVLDPNDEGNASFNHDETTESLVSNWNKHIANARGELYSTGPTIQELTKHNEIIEIASTEARVVYAQASSDKAADEAEDDEPLVKPKLNIYLRPATAADLSELTRIYNWYIVNSSQPAELLPINEEEMRSRMQFCDDSKLPFIVAAKKSLQATKPVPLIDSEQYSQRRGLPVTHKPQSALTRIENLAGFCCANDFTQPDFVEHISADIEIYVDPGYHRMGVGKCLMDKMLQICDGGHKLRMDVPFHCAAEAQHKYAPGGARSLHKLYVLLRTWHTPKAAKIQVGGGRKSRKPAFMKTLEGEYERWLRRWFESLEFEVEGHLKRIGAKHGRYIDLIYLSRDTCWAPAEGDVPDPMPELLNGGMHDDDDND